MLYLTVVTWEPLTVTDSCTGLRKAHAWSAQRRLAIAEALARGPRSFRNLGQRTSDSRLNIEAARKGN